MYPTADQAEHHPSSSLLQNSWQHSEARSSRACLSGRQSREQLRGDQYLPPVKSGWQFGLQTPPSSDEMGTAYPTANMAPHANQHWPALSTSSRESRAANEPYLGPFTETVTDMEPRYQQQQQQQQQQRQHQQQDVPNRPSGMYDTGSQQLGTFEPSTRPGPAPSCTLSAASTKKPNGEISIAARDALMTKHSLELPSCIGRGGDLVDLTCQITCMIWFEPISTVEAAERIWTVPCTSPVRRLGSTALPHEVFRDWVREVLKTTQVAQNVVLLALMYIYRLKITNPAVRGQAGSEYRLLTVALMLGNKFLDDNTYTNKTWADVSKIDVKEIHVMEVEFLSNMRYNLLASKGEWEEWLVKLSGFKEYCDRAQRSVPAPLAIPTAGYRGSFVSPLPSPTGMLQTTTPTSQRAYSPMSAMVPTNGATDWQSTNYPIAMASLASSPLAPRSVLPTQNHRKRSLEDDVTEPAPKRLSRQPQPQPQPQRNLQQLPTQLQAHSQQHLVNHDHSYRLSSMQDRYTQPRSAVGPEAIRLPVPNAPHMNSTDMHSSMSGAAHGSGSNSGHSGHQFAPQQTSSLSLPPLVPGVRAMSTVFTPSTTSFAPQLVLGSTGPTIPPVSAPSLTPITNYPISNFSTPTRRVSPQDSLAPVAAPTGYASSPSAHAYSNLNLTPMKNMATASGVHTPLSQSPSIYLQQRPSPYKPVRSVNTLLYPPPSAFLEQYHYGGGVPPTQMHYQPLGRREIRTGILPEFIMGGRSNASNGYQHQPCHQGMHQVPQQQPHYVQG